MGEYLGVELLIEVAENDVPLFAAQKDLQQRPS